MHIAREATWIVSAGIFAVACSQRRRELGRGRALRLPRRRLAVARSTTADASGVPRRSRRPSRPTIEGGSPGRAPSTRAHSGTESDARRRRRRRSAAPSPTARPCRESAPAALASTAARRPASHRGRRRTPPAGVSPQRPRPPAIRRLADDRRLPDLPGRQPVEHARRRPAGVPGSPELGDVHREHEPGHAPSPGLGRLVEQQVRHPLGDRAGEPAPGAHDLRRERRERPGTVPVPRRTRASRAAPARAGTCTSSSSIPARARSTRPT